MRYTTGLLTSGLLAVLASYPVQAEEEAGAAKVWSGSAELGTIRTSGNTSTSSISGSFDLKRDTEIWDSRLRLTALTSKEEGVTSKEKYTGTVQFDRSFSETSYLAIVGNQERDRFSGFEYQGTAALGYGHRLIQRDNMKLDIEAGPGYRREKIKATREIDDEAIARVAAKFSWTISEGVELFEEFTADMGDQNSIYRSETGLKSRINGSLATRLSYKARYVDQVPDGNENLDTEFGVTLVVSF